MDSQHVYKVRNGCVQKFHDGAYNALKYLSLLVKHWCIIYRANPSVIAIEKVSFISSLFIHIKWNPYHDYILPLKLFGVLNEETQIKRQTAGKMEPLYLTTYNKPITLIYQENER